MGTYRILMTFQIQLIYYLLCLNLCTSLAGVAQWIECQAENQRAAHLISNLGHMPGLWTRSPTGGVREATTHYVYLPLLLPSFPSVKINE